MLMRKLEVFYADMTALHESLKKMSMFYFLTLLFSLSFEKANSMIWGTSPYLKFIYIK